MSKDNKFFRNLLEEVRAAPEKKKETAAVPANPSSGPKKKSQGSEKYRRLLEQKAKQKEKETEDNKYRDRADERRKEKIIEPENEIAAIASVDIEMSKYLGGDVAHTHLVKGLDYALLSKVRGELGSTMGSAPAAGDGQPKEVLKTAKVRGFSFIRLHSFLERES